MDGYEDRMRRAWILTLKHPLRWVPDGRDQTLKGHDDGQGTRFIGGCGTPQACHGGLRSVEPSNIVWRAASQMAHGVGHDDVGWPISHGVPVDTGSIFAAPRQTDGRRTPGREWEGGCDADHGEGEVP